MKSIKAKKLSLDALVQVIENAAPERNISKPVKFGKFLATNAKEWGYELIKGTHVDANYYGGNVHFLELYYDTNLDEGRNVTVITIVDGAVRMVVP